jgi:hypothetical protein
MYLVHAPVHFAKYLLISCSFIYQAIYLPVCPKAASELSTLMFPPSLPSALIKQPVKEGGQCADGHSHIGTEAVFLEVCPASILC